MGIHDRQYYQEFGGGQPPKLGMPKTAIGWIILTNAIVFLVLMLFDSPKPAGAAADAGSVDLESALTLHLDFFRRPWTFFEFLTYGFLHSGVFHLLGNMLILFILGRDVEQRYGRREFAIFFLTAIVFSGVVWWTYEMVQNQLMPPDVPFPAWRGPRMVGASGGCVAAVILYCLNYPRRTLLLMGVAAVPAWAVGIGYVLLDMTRALDPESNVAWQAHLGGAAFALLYFRSRIRLSRFAPKSLGSLAPKLSKPKLRLHDPEDHYEKLERTGDEILAKMHKYGEESLTAKERKQLEEYSRRMRQKHS